MKRIGVFTWPLVVTGSLLVSAMLTACGGGTSADTQAAQGSTPPAAAVSPQTGALRLPATNPSASSGASSSSSSSAPANTPAAALKPQIQGTAPGTATVGQNYAFQPQATGGAGSLTFAVANKPAWATFNASTGLLTGTPAASDVGNDPSIEISVTDGQSVVSLAPFNVTVANAPAQQSAPGTVKLSWLPPTENEDGSALANLAGYNIHYGTQPQDYTQVIKVANPGLATYVIDNLPAGTYYFSVAAYNTAGVESGFSPEVSAAVN